MKLRRTEIKPLRERLLLEQGHKCALCLEHIEAEQAVLDHCHKTGLIRSVLHRGCNAFISHIENNQKRNLITPNRLTMILANFARYVTATKPWLHPTHLTAEEKAERILKRNRKRAKKLRDSKRNP